MKKIVFVLSIFLFANIVCFGQTQLEMNMDAQKAYEKADAVMTETYKQLSKKLTAPKQKQLLLESQRAWIKYKEAHCKAFANQYDQGSMQPMVYSQCLTELTSERNEKLKQYDVMSGL